MATEAHRECILARGAVQHDVAWRGWRTPDQPERETDAAPHRCTPPPPRPPVARDHQPAANAGRAPEATGSQSRTHPHSAKPRRQRRKLPCPRKGAARWGSETAKSATFIPDTRPARDTPEARPGSRLNTAHAASRTEDSTATLWRDENVHCAAVAAVTCGNAPRRHRTQITKLQKRPSDQLSRPTALPRCALSTEGPIAPHRTRQDVMPGQNGAAKGGRIQRRSRRARTIGRPLTFSAHVCDCRVLPLIPG